MTDKTPIVVVVYFVVAIFVVTRVDSSCSRFNFNEGKCKNV